ncbi:hypothetical protein [Mesorhizobium sp. M6A.T.Ce.TU.002.03.1.1]|uniref:hypothetical protein n=1 Tax=unclassified Mesorhizobium TaxID=325217 RepID=UPI0032AEC2E7
MPGIKPSQNILSSSPLSVPYRCAGKAEGRGLAMKRAAGLWVIAGAVLAGATCQSNAASLNTMDDVGAAIQACWTPPADAGNSTVTLSFSFKRNGTLIGPPRPAAINVTGDAKARQSFVDAAIAAVEDCLPLSFSPALAQGIAGNIFTLQFSSPKQ